MARIELHERFFGGGLTGSVDLQSQPALSWSEHNALLTGAASALLTESHARAAVHAIERAGLSVNAVAREIDRLEATISLGLQQQTVILSRQVDLLADIADALRTPAKTRAAERLVDVGELLRRERWTRARDVAADVIESDPNNPAGFLAAAWAHLGLKNLDAAREHALEAAEASDGRQRSRCGRQAARLSLALDEPAHALDTLQRFATAAPTRMPTVTISADGIWFEMMNEWLESVTENTAVDYDRSVYLCVLKRDSDALKAFENAAGADRQFYASALVDPFLQAHPQIQEQARSGIREAQERNKMKRHEIDSALSEAERQRAAADAIVEGGGIVEQVPHECPGGHRC